MEAHRELLLTLHLQGGDRKISRVCSTGRAMGLRGYGIHLGGYRALATGLMRSWVGVGAGVWEGIVYG